MAKLQSEKNELEKNLRSLQESNTQLTAKISELGQQLEAEKQKNRDLPSRLRLAVAMLHIVQVLLKDRGFLFLCFKLLSQFRYFSCLLCIAFLKRALVFF